jgi:hypothetical protein
MKKIFVTCRLIIMSNFIISIKIIMKKIFNYINIPVFFVSLSFGLLAVYLISDENRIIYVYPTPDNVDIIQYKDKTGKCFEYEAETVDCPKDKNLMFFIKPQV